MKRNIYIKDKDLDKSKYKPSRLDELNVNINMNSTLLLYKTYCYKQVYIKNYMKDDPKIMKNEEEMNKLIEEAELLKKQ